MVRLNRDEVRRYLDDRRAGRFNAVLVNLVEHHFGGPRNRDGQSPFLTPGDFSTPNDAYFANADFVVEQAAQRDILVLLAPMYLGYQGGEEGWYRELLANGTAKCREYGRYVGRRYARFPNVVWVHGGDTSPMDGLDEVEAIVAGIKESDSAHLHTAHSAPHRSALDDYDRPWLEVNTTYTRCEDVVTAARTDQLRGPGRPFFHIEGLYENYPGASTSCLVNQAVHPVMLGGRGHVFGNKPMWQFDPTWPSALGSPGATYMTHVTALFTSRHGSSLVPDLERGIVIGGGGDPNSTDFAAAARTPDAASVLVYVPTGRTITVDLGRVPGPESVAWWYDLLGGSAQRIGVVRGPGSMKFTSPGDGPFMLVFDDAAANLPAPGAGPLPFAGR
jgi:hypothetical protein